MDFRTIVDIDKPSFEIQPCEKMLFVGSCFADNIGAKFVEEKFRATVNPFGVMYNPASIQHTVQRISSDNPANIAVFTLGTNHVYILNETGKIVDNCQKRPQRFFTEKELSVDECVNYLSKAAEPFVHVIITVSPIRYAKYGYHGSALSKATLLLAANELVARFPDKITYFPAYEIVNDELRDYRFYKSDMLHPSEQAVEYIYERFAETFFSSATKQFVLEWKPIREALSHKPFHPESEEYKKFILKTRQELDALRIKYPLMP